MNDIYEILKKTKKASRSLVTLSSEKKNEVLLAMADKLEQGASEILSANAIDVENAKSKYSSVMIDRLALSESRIKGMADGIRQVVALSDPVGEVIENYSHANGMSITRVSVPLGVVAIIYESRPNVTSDAGALCFKSGNACILKGGKEAYNTSCAIVKLLKQALTENGVDPECINVPLDTSRETTNIIMQATDYVDVLIPRGGAGLIRSCVENAKVPCIQTGTGICHVFVDESAKQEKALAIIENAKTSRPSVCNAEEVLLVHKNIAQEFLPKVKKLLVDDRIANGKQSVELRLCEKSAQIIDGKIATDTDFDTEFLDYILAVKIVDDYIEAIEHVANHSTHHSDCIVTETQSHANAFTLNVDSAVVYVNASTRFTDGGEFGKGCEIGISTQKMHARGPMGLKALTSYKYIVKGEGQTR